MFTRSVFVGLVVESLCDPYALAEMQQPHMFVAPMDLEDGVLVPYIVIPPEESWLPMQLTADEACRVTGKVTFVGEDG